MEIYAGIVTYNPDLLRLKENLIHIIPQVKSVVIFDNNSSNIIELVRFLQEFFREIILLKSDKNKGVAYALNQICTWGVMNGYHWVLTLDQDSVCSDNLIEVLKKYEQQDIAIISPNIIYRNNEKYTRSQKKEFEEVEWVITSASLTNLKVWKKINGFDEWLFIDKVDYDYGVRANRAGYKIVRTYKVDLLHELGNLKCRRFLGRTIFVTNHPPIRYYYMIRNSIYLSKKLQKGFPVSVIMKNVLKIVFFENHKLSKLNFIGRGIKDGILSTI